MHHSSNGLFFKREADGSVTITKTADGLAIKKDGSNILFRQTLSAEHWCSAVCSMSVGGEEHCRWYIAMDFHNTANANGDDDPRFNGIGTPTLIQE